MITHVLEELCDEREVQLPAAEECMQSKASQLRKDLAPLLHFVSYNGQTCALPAWKRKAGKPWQLIQGWQNKLVSWK